jgi:hypothetical protein
MQKRPQIFLSIRHSPHCGNSSFTYYSKRGKTYTKKEYYKMIRRKEAIKEIVLTIIQIIIFVIFVVFRAYVFLEYGK